MADDKGYSDSSFEAEPESSRTSHTKAALHFDVEQWSVSHVNSVTSCCSHTILTDAAQVLDWLRSIGHDRLCSLFKDQEISGKVNINRSEKNFEVSPPVLSFVYRLSSGSVEANEPRSARAAHSGRWYTGTGHSDSASQNEPCSAMDRR